MSTSSARSRLIPARPPLSQPLRPRARIIAAARRHFFMHGFRNVSMDDLAAELGMSKKTLYRHFKTKQALLKAVIGQKFNEVETQLDAVVAETRHDVLRGLHELVQRMQEQIAEIQPAFVRDMRRESPQIFDWIVKRRAAVFERCFTVVFAKGRKAGIIRPDIAPKVAIEIVLGAINGIMNPPKVAELGLTPQSAYAAIMSVFFEGVMTAQGRRG